MCLIALFRPDSRPVSCTFQITSMADALISIPAIMPSSRSSTMSTSRFCWSRKCHGVSGMSEAVMSFRISENT